MNKLDTKKRAQIVACLVERNSLRATCRLTEAAKGTVIKLLVGIVTIGLYGMSLAGASSEMRYGHSAIQKKRTSRKISRGN